MVSERLEATVGLGVLLLAEMPVNAQGYKIAQ